MGIQGMMKGFPSKAKATSINSRLPPESVYFIFFCFCFWNF